MDIYPIEYKVIPTQYTFLLKKKQGEYIVQVHATRDLKDKVFPSEVEAMEYINQAEVI